MWYPREEGWQSLVKQRLEHGLETFNLELTYEDDYGVDAKVKGMTFLGQHLELGGNFVEHEQTRWRMSGQF